MNTKQQNIFHKGSRWLRVGLFTFATVGPIVNTFLAQSRQRFPSLRAQVKNVQETAYTARKRLDDLSLISRKRATEQASQLQRQAHLLQKQARQLRKALKREAKQQRRLEKVTKQLRKARKGWNTELLKRRSAFAGFASQSGEFSTDLLERGNQVTTDLVKRGQKVSQNLAKRSNKMTQKLSKRSKVSHELTKRSNQLASEFARRTSDATHDLTQRSQQRIRPQARSERNSTLWTIVGFSVGLLAAGVTTYLLVRRRQAQAILEQEEQEQGHIELPMDNYTNGTGNSSTNRPAGEIHFLQADDFPVTGELASDDEPTDPEIPAIPPYTTFVGVLSTKQYYPVAAFPEATDIIYFASEDEALAEGFTIATIVME